MDNEKIIGLCCVKRELNASAKCIDQDQPTLLVFSFVSNLLQLKENRCN